MSRDGPAAARLAQANDRNAQSAGADLRRGDDSAEAEMHRQTSHFAESGRFFHDITALSAARIPTVSLVFGSSTAGGAY